MSRTTASDRVRRLLALVPWVTANSPVSVDDVCSRFGLSRAALLADLEVLPYVGVPPYTPDTMIGVDIDDDLIVIRLSEPFDRPLRLTSAQALALIAAGHSIRDVPGSDAGDPLQRGLAKLAEALGVSPEQVHIALGEGQDSAVDSLTTAISDGVQVELDYYAYSRDERSVRTVDPYRIVANGGNWYLIGWCHRSSDVRAFRVDRIAHLTVTDEPVSAPPDDVEWDRYRPDADDPRVTLDLSPTVRWFVEQNPVDAIEELDGGALRVTIAVSARPWLERVLVTLGSAATVVAAPDDLADAGPDAARRILARYGEV